MSIPLLGPSGDPEIEDIRLAEEQFNDLQKKYFYADCRPVDEYKKLVDCKVGQGSSGLVYKAQDNRSGDVVAVKKLRIDRKQENGLNNEFYREINFLKNLKHENVIRLKEVVVGIRLESIFLVMEYCDEDLGKVIEKMKIPFSQDEIKNLMKQLFTGLSYLHDNFVVHRDINPSNLLFNHYGVLKIADFGSAKMCCPDMTPRIGTICYRAAEILLGFETYTNAVDIWSSGCVFAELLRHTVLFPYQSEMAIISKMIDLLGTPNDNVMPGFSTSVLARSYTLKKQPYNKVRQVFKDMSEAGVDLLKALLRYNAALRPSAKDCLIHDYFEEEPVACDCLMLKMSIMQKKMDHENDDTMLE